MSFRVRADLWAVLGLNRPTLFFTNMQLPTPPPLKSGCYCRFCFLYCEAMARGDLVSVPEELKSPRLPYLCLNLSFFDDTAPPGLLRCSFPYCLFKDDSTLFLFFGNCHLGDAPTSYCPPKDGIVPNTLLPGAWLPDPLFSLVAALEGRTKMSGALLSFLACPGVIREWTSLSGPGFVCGLEKGGRSPPPPTTISGSCCRPASCFEFAIQILH